MYKSHRLLPVALIAVGALALAACSSSSNNAASPTSTASASDSVSATVLAAVDAAKKPAVFTAPGGPVDISGLKGKKVFEMASAPNPFMQSISDAMKKVAESAGLKYTVFANQGQVSQWVQGINQAISSKQDIIILNGCPDPRALQPQLQAAKAAGIPVTCVHFYDDSSPLPPACDGCTNLAGVVTAPFYTAGRYAADWIIADSGGKAHTLIVGGSDILPSPGTIDAMQKEFSANCPDCVQTVMNIPVADWNTKTQGEIQAALQRDPSINYVYVLYDAMVAGALPAVTTLGRTNVKIASYNGSPFALDNIRNGTAVAMNVGEDTPGIGYAQMDQVFRILAGQPVIPTRTPIRIWDKTNVSEAGNPAKPGIGYGDSFTRGYEALWQK